MRPPQVPHRPAAPTTFSETLIARVQLHVSRIGIPPRLISNFFSLLSFFRRNCFLLSSFLLAEDVRVDFFFFCFRFILDFLSIEGGLGIQFILSFFFISTTYVPRNFSSIINSVSLEIKSWIPRDSFLETLLHFTITTSTKGSGGIRTAKSVDDLWNRFQSKGSI